MAKRKSKRKKLKILAQYPLPRERRKEFNKDLSEDLKSAKEEAQRESRRYWNDIDSLYYKGEVTDEEREQWKEASSEKSLYRQKRNRILRNLRERIEFEMSKVSYIENADYNNLERITQRRSPSIQPKEVLKILLERNIMLFLTCIQVAENKVTMKKGKFVLLTGRDCVGRMEKLDREIERLIGCENRIFDKKVPFPFFPASLRSFSRKYELPCNAKKTLSIINNSKWADCIYILQMPKRDKVVCINEEEFGKEWEGLAELAEYIRRECQRDKNFQNWKKLIAKIKGFTLGEAYMLMKRRIKAGVVSEELFCTKKPNHLLAKKIIRPRKYIL